MAHKIIVIGASAGGVEPVIELCNLLPPQFAAALFIVIHTTATAPSLLPAILNRRSALLAVHTQDNQPIEAGKIYIALPNHHLMLDKNVIRLSHGPRENFARPSIDVLFRSAAQTFGPRVIAVVLSGTLSDGTAGMLAVQHHGGVTIVQDPQEALFPGMPSSVIQAMQVDYVLTVKGIGETLQRLVNDEQPRPPAQVVAPDQKSPNSDQSSQSDRTNYLQGSYDNLPRSLLTCPECGGVLWETHEKQLVRFVCQTGHAFSEESLLEGQNDKLETSIWSAIRVLKERSAISWRLAARAAQQGKDLSAARFTQRAKEADDSADYLRQLINGKILSKDDSLNDNGS